MKEYRFICPLPNGIHARPASCLEEVARKFDSEITLTNVRIGKSANLKSVLSVVSADIRQDDECLLAITGEDHAAAYDMLVQYIDQDFPHCDEKLPELEEVAGEAKLPRVLACVDFTYLTGRPVVKGIGCGQAVLLDGLNVSDEVIGVKEDAVAEKIKAEQAVRSLTEKFDAASTHAASKVEGDILKAHLSIVRDPEFSEMITSMIASSDLSAGQGVMKTAEYYSEQLRKTDSKLLHERITDIQDVAAQLLVEIYGADAEVKLPELTAPSVIITENLSPSRFLALDRNNFKALVLAHAAETSHTVILARSFGIPTLTGVEDLMIHIQAGTELIADASRGLLVTADKPEVSRFYDREFDRIRRRDEELKQFVDADAKTADGTRVEVASNIASAGEAEAAFAKGAEGIGLFRTEMLFMDREQAPDEEEQFEAYMTVLKAAGDKPVIIRTFDIGGDKPVAYLNIPEEFNPFLGYRGVRIYPQFEELIRIQIRALLRASVFGKLKVMVPMVSMIEEMRWMRKITDEVQQELTDKNIAFDAEMALGMMIETPSAAYAAKDFAAEVDFFSIGTNDLTQYFHSVDRDNSQVAHLYECMNPPFIRLLKQIVDDAHAADTFVGMCGEMAGKLEYLPLLVGLGLDEISLSAPNIPTIKTAVSQLKMEECRKLVADVMAVRATADARELLDTFNSRSSDLPMLDQRLIVIDSESSSKEEAIREIIDNFYVYGRTEDADALEATVWKREETYSTGFGEGFAIPHCKTDLVKAGTIGIARLKNPAEWGSLDGKPVNFVILLTMRDSDAGQEHMRVFSQLARSVMRQEFRDGLSRAVSEKEIFDQLSSLV